MIFREHFNSSKELLHLNNAGMTPMSIPCQKAINEIALLNCELGAHGLEPMLARFEKARESVGKLINLEAKQIAFVNNCSTAISIVAFGMPMKAGGEIVITDQEYPSNRYPWHSRAKKDNLKMVEVTSETDGKINWDKFIHAIGPKTQVVAFSWVQFGTGVRAPLKEISQTAKKYGARVVVDIVQGLGVIPFDFKNAGVDAVACGSHKWLCGQLGHGFIGVTPDLCQDIYPYLQGALTFGVPNAPFNAENTPHKSAARFESGGVNIVGTVGLGASVDLLLSCGVDKIYREAMALKIYFSQALKEQGHKIIADLPENESSPILTFIPLKPVDEVASRLRSHKIAFAPRYGGIRISPHAFNTRGDLDRVLEVLK